MSVKAIYRVILLLVTAVFLCSCATADFTDVSSSVVRGDYSLARNTLEAQKGSLYTENDKVLYNLDAGLLSHYSGDWNQSNKNLSDAEGLIEEYYSKSISQGVSSYFVNDMVIDYAGEDYEDIYTNFFMALNYIQLGKFDDAMVEIRRFDNKQKLLSTKYDAQLEYAESELGPGYSNVSVQFQNSAAARYLSMLLYRANGQSDSAEVDRKLLLKAFNDQPSLYTFNVPSCVNDEVSVPKGKARLNFIAFTGQAPIKVEDVTRISITDGLNCKIAVPIMVSMGSNVKSISVDVYDASGKLQTTVESAANNYSVEIPEVIPEEIVPVEIPEEVYTPTEAPKKTSNANRVISSKSALSKVNEVLEKYCTARARKIIKDETGYFKVTEASESSKTTTTSTRTRNSSTSASKKNTSTSSASTASASSSSKESSSSRSSASSRARDLVRGVVSDSTNSGLGGSSSSAETAAVSGQNAVCSTMLERIESIENIALDTFGQHASVISSRAMIRALGKTMKTGVLGLASSLTDDKSLSELFSVLSFASQITDEITEKADLRTSRFFPAYIYVGGITLDPGVYTVVISFKGGSGQVMSSKTYTNVNVTAKSVNIVEAICSK